MLQYTVIATIFFVLTSATQLAIVQAQQEEGEEERQKELVQRVSVY